MRLTVGRSRTNVQVGLGVSCRPRRVACGFYWIKSKHEKIDRLAWRKIMLREFLYLDTALVDTYLAQLEDGLYDESRDLTREGSGKRAEAGVRAAVVSASAGVHGDSNRESERVYRQTPESRFNRLYGKLGARNVPDGEFYKSMWGDVAPKEILDVACDVDIPTMSRLMVEGGQLSDIVQLMQSFSPGEVSQGDQGAMDGIQALAARSGDKFIATGELSATDPVFAFKLSKKYLRTGIEDLEGEVNVVGKVERKWPESESYSLMEIPGLSLMSRKERRSMDRRMDGNKSEATGFQLDGPGISMGVIAIYR